MITHKPKHSSKLNLKLGYDIDSYSKLEYPKMVDSEGEYDTHAYLTCKLIEMSRYILELEAALASAEENKYDSCK